MAKHKYYAVQKGKTPGVYSSWDEAKEQIEGFGGAVYKSFTDKDEAIEFLKKDGYDKKAPTEQPEEPDGAYAFVDGSYNPDTCVSGYGGFFVEPKKTGEERVKHLLQGTTTDKSLTDMRNVAGEMLGAIAAIEKAKSLGYKQMTMFYDYEGIRSWATGDWRTNNENTMRYASFVKNSGVDIDFIHTKGHSGIEGNEMADKLAKEAVEI